MILFSLLFISCYMGIFGQDNSIKDGKNLLNFMLIYLVGNEMKTNVILKKNKVLFNLIRNYENKSSIRCN